MGSTCQNAKFTSNLSNQGNGTESKQIIKRAYFEHPKQVQDSFSSISSCSDKNSHPSISPNHTQDKVKTSDFIFLNKTETLCRRIHSSLNQNSLSPLKKDYNGNFSDLSVELVADTSVKLTIPFQARRSFGRRRVTTKVDLLNKVKKMKYSEKLKRRKT